MLTMNIPLAWDWLRWRRTYLRQPYFWLLLLIATIQILFCCCFESIVGRQPQVGWQEFILYCYFLGFHVYIQLLVPLLVYLSIRNRQIATLVETYRLLPVPERDIFNWLWLRHFVKYSLLLLIAYFPLYLPFPGLYKWESDYNLNERMITIFEIGCDAGMIILFFLPILQPKKLKLATWTGLLALLVIFPFCRFDDFPWDWNDDLWGSNARFHPLITLPYFVISMLFSVALAVHAGLAQINNRIHRRKLLLLLPLVFELLLLHLFYFFEMHYIYSWAIIYLMLYFYRSSFGIFWLGLKWNLCFYFSRKFTLRQDA